MHPKATPRQIAKAASSSANILLSQGIDRLVVLMDREDNTDCPSKISTNVAAAFTKLGFTEVYVVIKDKKFENWLIADPLALKQYPRRFNVNKSFERKVSRNKADNVPDAEALSNTACKGGAFHKRKDASEIARAQSVTNVAANSRSFRRFLRVLTYPNYATQSKNP